MERVLFVGGLADGRRISVSPQSTMHRVPAMPELGASVVRFDIYERAVFCADGVDVHLFMLQGMTHEGLLARLMQHYVPPASGKWSARG